MPPPMPPPPPPPPVDLPKWWPPPFLDRCTPRILVVTDSLNFDAADGFGLTAFLAELAQYQPSPQITTMKHSAAVRFGDQHTIKSFDQIWLFGAAGVPLSDDEVRVLVAFMDAGGGVFATGDHADLGFNLCGTLPRVRQMREWLSTPMEYERIDTVINPGRNHKAQFHDQSDDIPQHMFPTYYGSGDSWAPHALLRSGIGDIDVLPDHPHESECYAGTDLGAVYRLHGLDFPEFPPYQGSPLAPEIVARSVSAGRYLVDAGKPPTTPRVFGAIAAWDGHLVRRGRIVCDATWHHFVNINLNGTGAVADAVDARKGLRDALGNPTQDYVQVGNYYRNILDWLIPRGRRWCSIFIDLLLQRYRYPLFEEFRPLPHPCPWEPRVALGSVIEAALQGTHGNGHADDLVVSALEAAELERIADVMRPRPTGRRADEMLPLLGTVELRRGILGSVADALLRDLPADTDELTAALEKLGHDDAVLEKAAAQAARESLAAAASHFKEVAARTMALLG